LGLAQPGGGIGVRERAPQASVDGVPFGLIKEMIGDVAALVQLMRNST
jgi:hypothetical protein